VVIEKQGATLNGTQTPELSNNGNNVVHQQNHHAHVPLVSDRRRNSGHQTNKFVEMLKGYGIKVEYDPKTQTPIITDQMIKELEKKTKGKIADQMNLKPGVKIIERSPEKDKIREKGIFMTKYDNQTGFPRITKDMYLRAKESTNIILKERVEEELARKNAAHVTQDIPTEKTESSRESTHKSSLPVFPSRAMQQKPLLE